MNSLGRAIKLLEMMGRHSGGLTNSQISRFLHISTSSTSYLLSQLEREGCVKRDEDTARYQVGLRLVSLAQGALGATGFYELSGSAMCRLAEATRLTVTLGVLERGEVLCLGKINHADGFEAGPARAPFAVAPVQKNARPNPAANPGIEPGVVIGGRTPVWESAGGKVLAAFLPPAELIELTASDTRASRDPALLKELNQIRVQGHAVVDSGGVRSIAAPITNRSGVVCASLSVVGRPSNPLWADPCQVLSLVREAAFQISRRAVQYQTEKISELSGRFRKGSATEKSHAEAR